MPMPAAAPRLRVLRLPCRVLHNTFSLNFQIEKRRLLCEGAAPRSSACLLSDYPGLPASGCSQSADPIGRVLVDRVSVYDRLGRGEADRAAVTIARQILPELHVLDLERE